MKTKTKAIVIERLLYNKNKTLKFKSKKKITKVFSISSTTFKKKRKKIEKTIKNKKHKTFLKTLKGKKNNKKFIKFFN